MKRESVGERRSTTQYHRVHPLKRASSSCVYSQCAVHIVVGPCAKGHFIHGKSLDPEFFFFFYYSIVFQGILC
jgi:hypothetical protein